MNLPNILTVSRLFLAFILMALLAVPFPFSKTLALLVFAMAGISDYLDGYYARKDNIVTSFGQLMDPLTDKIMVCAAFVGFVEIAIPHSGTFLHAGIKVGSASIVPLVPAWIAVVIISREFLVTGLRLLALSRGVVISAGKWGKHKTVWQIVVIVVLLLGLSIRADYLPLLGSSAVTKFDFAFMFVAHAVSLAVALVTVASGYLYFVQHRDMITRH